MKAREINSPLIKQLIEETTPEELAKIDTDMTNNKQETAVDWIELKLNSVKPIDFCSIETIKDWVQQAKEMEKQQKQMSYADGYAEGYKRALEMVDWYIKNHISGMVQDHIVEANKMVGGGNQ
jgi:hypothetical protein